MTRAVPLRNSGPHQVAMYVSRSLTKLLDHRGSATPLRHPVGQPQASRMVTRDAQWAQPVTPPGAFAPLQRYRRSPSAATHGGD